MKYSKHKLGGRRVHIFRPTKKLRNSNRLINIIFRPNRKNVIQTNSELIEMDKPLYGSYKVEVREFNNPTRLTTR